MAMSFNVSARKMTGRCLLKLACKISLGLSTSRSTYSTILEIVCSFATDEASFELNNLFMSTCLRVDIGVDVVSVICDDTPVDYADGMDQVV